MVRLLRCTHGRGRPRTGPGRREALRRELWRVRNSAPFRLGHHVIEAFRRPWQLLVLPSRSQWSVGHRHGIAGPQASSHVRQHDPTSRRSGPLCCPVQTNGVGFGHFTHMYASLVRKQDPDLVVFFTTQPTLHLPIPRLSDMPSPDKAHEGHGRRCVERHVPRDADPCAGDPPAPEFRL